MKDAIALLRADHRHIERHFQTFREILANRGGAAGSRRRLARRIDRDLAAHLRIEADEVFPAIPTNSPAAASGLARMLEEHAQLRALLSEIGVARPTKDDFDTKMVIFFGAMRDHFATEERVLFPLLDATPGADRLPAEKGEASRPRPTA